MRRLIAVAVVAVAVVALPSAPAQPLDLGTIHFLDRNQVVGGPIDGEARPMGFRFYGDSLGPDVAQWPVHVYSTSDPVGLLVLANREARNAASYEGMFRLHRRATNAALGVLHVAHGDVVTIVYTDPDPDSDDPARHKATATWRARSEEPDFREMTYLRPAVGQDLVIGAAETAGALAEIRIYDAEDGVVPIATGAARQDGSFSVRFAGTAETSGLLWVSTAEGDLPESNRIEVHRAAIAGRLVAPADDGPATAPVADAFMELYKPDANRPYLSAFTDRGGRFTTGGTQFEIGVYPGQGDVQGGLPFWSWESYGMPARRTVTNAPEGLTRVIDDIELRSPNVVGHVVDGLGFNVAEAYVTEPSTFTDDGTFIDTYTRTDGRFALHLPDGHHRLRVRSPIGCAVNDEVDVTVTVEDGKMTSPQPRIVLGPPEPLEVGGTTIPLAPAMRGGPILVGLDGAPGEVDVRIDDPSGRGRLSAGCPGEMTSVPSVNVVNPGVDLGARSVEFSSARVCLGYTNQRLRRRDLREGQIEVLHWPRRGAAQVVTTKREPGENRICGRARNFGAFAVGVKLPRPRLTLRAVADRINEGDVARLRGRLTRRDGRTPIDGRRVAVSWRRQGGTDWRRLAVRTTSERGYFALRNRPDSDVEYRARFKGNQRWAPTRSPAVDVNVRNR